MKHFFEMIIIAPLYCLFRVLPLWISQPFCALVARFIGPLLSVSRGALENIRTAFPEKSSPEHRRILRECWDNLGRVVAEFPHVPRLLRNPKNFEIQNIEILQQVLQTKKACIFFTAHMANWEIGYAAFLRSKVHINLIARHHGNPLIEWLLMRGRTKQGITMISRTVEGSRQLLKAIHHHEMIGALLDQYASDGAFLPFFGRPAKTTLALARMAIRYDLPFLPVQVRRVGKKSKFIITFTSPLQGATAEILMTDANQRLESWIRQEPAQWLWLHKRWKVKGRDKPTQL